MLSERFTKFLIYSGLFLIVLFIVIFAYNEVFFEFSKKVNSEKFGQLGDIIGGMVGSLWALAGVIMFYLALSEQRRDFKNNQKALNAQIEALKIQSNEFKLQRLELEETRNIYIEQTKTFKIQQFESTFFNILTLHHELVNDITIKEKKAKNKNGDSDNGETYYELRGRRCFEYLYDKLLQFHEKHLALEIFDEDIEVVRSAYLDFYNKYQPIIGHYLMNLYYITKLITDQAVDNNELYGDMLRSQLSSTELLLLFYHGLSKYGEGKLKTFIEKFHFLRALPIEDLLSMEHSDLYHESAYQKE